MSKTAGPTGMLANLTNTVFNGSSFIDQTNNAYYHSGSTGFDILRQHIALDASHDANIVKKPKCSPNTRTRILKELETWMDDPMPEHKIIWLSGPAGAGKSAIAQTTLQCAETKGQLGASFFFSRDAKGRNKADRLFPTLSYQLTRNIPELAQSVDDIVRADPDLPIKSLKKQFMEFIDRPTRECNLNIAYPLIGIDGVDECDDEEFLTIISDSVKSQVPLRFLISSRPDPRIRALFTKLNLYMREIILETSPESLQDVSNYLSAGFADIRERHSHFLRDVPDPWPSDCDLGVLRAKSSGHFAYPAALLKFVGGNKHLNPIRQLDIILGRTPETKPVLRASQYLELDRLFHQVLSNHPNRSQLCQILMFFVVPGLAPFPRLLDDLLKLDRGTVMASLSSMHSLISVSESDSANNPSTFHHASFEDFLLDQSRSKCFYVDKQQSLKLVISACTDFLVKLINQASQKDEMPDIQVRSQGVASHPFAISIHLSDWQSATIHICNWFKSSLRHDAARLINNIIPKQHDIFWSKPMIFILHELDEVIRYADLPISMWLFNQTPIPHSGLQAIYKKYLQNTSSNLHFILGPPCILALEFLPMNVLAKLYHFDLSPFIKEFYHLLDLSNLPHVRFGRCFKAHIWQTFQKVRTEERLNGKFYMELTEKGLQFLTAEQDQRECRLVAQALQRHAMGSHLHQYIDNIVVYLRVLKKRPFECREQPHSDCDGSLNSGMILDSMIRAFKARDDLSEKRDVVAKISKELLYVTNDSPPRIKIHQCFLSAEPVWHADLDFFEGFDRLPFYSRQENKDWSYAMTHPLPPSDFQSPHLATDFRFFVPSFNREVFLFLMDPQRAGELYIPMYVLRHDLDMLRIENNTVSLT